MTPAARRASAFAAALAAFALAPASPAPDRQTDRSALWTRAGRNVIAGFRNMYNLHVLRVPDRAFPYRGWFFGWAASDCNRGIPGYRGCDAVFAARARALDGPWQVYADDGRWDATGSPALWRPVVSPDDTWFDEWHNGDPSVARVGRTFYMAYSAVGHNRDRVPAGAPGDRDGSLLCIRGAASEDGVHWRRSDRPILLHAPDVGAPTVSEGDAHAFGSYHRPTLLREGGRFRLWFDYWAGREKGLAMGYAENRGDFLNAHDWRVVRADDDPCLAQFPNPDVVRAGDLLHAFGDPAVDGEHPWRSRKIVEAVSRDGLRWLVLGQVRPDADAEAIHVPEALVRRADGRTVLDLFYACQVGGAPYDYRYDRIRRMSRTLDTVGERGLAALWDGAFVRR